MRELDEYETKCGRILRQIPLFSSWRWDNDHAVASVTLDTLQANSVLEVLLSEFEEEWDFLTIDQTSPDFKALFISSFGMFPGQKVFTVEGELHIFFVLWWPWGDGERISLRVGLYSKRQQAFHVDMIEKKLRQWFAI